MKSNVCEITRDGCGLSDILREVEKVAAYNGLDEKQSLRLRLLAEELSGMLPELVLNFAGSFWVENNGADYELHVRLTADGLSLDDRERLLSVSKSGKNAAAIGIMGKIRAAAEAMLLASADADAAMPVGYFGSVGENLDIAYTSAWTLDRYRQKVREEQQKEAWDELEKSIVANLADDVIVGVRGKQVDIIIRKTFKA